jgi:UPF0755 protein
MNMIKRILNIAFLLIILLIGLFVFFLKSDYTNLTTKEEGYILLIEKGDNIRKIAEKLDINDIYKKPFTAFFVMRLMLKGKSINAGEYEILKNDSLFDLVHKIKHKIHYYRKITFIEGETASRYLEQINYSFGLLGNATEEIKEGYFMPGTYNYLYGETKNSLIKRAREDMINFVNTEFSKIENKEEFYLKNINEIISLASVVEKESGIGLERKLIAGVFLNRLKKGMRLQSDPTTIYEITKGKYKLDRPLTYADLTIKGEYNTYYIKGIPAFPIASPGKESIIAVLNPQKTESLFFVADGNGGHNFSDSYEEHLENVKIYKQSLKKDETK